MIKYAKGQIWYYLDENEKQDGSVQSGTRPVVIVSNNYGNKHSTICMIVPLTTSTTKQELPTHFTFFINNKLNTVLCEQIKTISQDKLIDYVGVLEYHEQKELDKCLNIALGLPKKEFGRQSIYNENNNENEKENENEEQR